MSCSRRTVKTQLVLLFDRAWQHYVESLDFASLESEVVAYNKYFPIEANLAIDPESGCFVWMGRDWKPLVAPQAQAQTLSADRNRRASSHSGVSKFDVLLTRGRLRVSNVILYVLPFNGNLSA